MTCFFSHKWPKWTEPVMRTITLPIVIGAKIEQTVVDRFVQERTCSACGRYERRVLNYSGDEA